jgi:hypothetical protein
MFGSFTNQALNLMRRTWRDARRTGDKEAYEAFAKSLILLMAVNPLAIMAINTLRDWIYGRENDESFIARYLYSIAGYMFFIRDLARSAISKIEKGTFVGRDVELPISKVPNLMTNVISNFADIITETGKKREEAAYRFVDDAVGLALLLMGIPYDGPKKITEAAIDIAKEGR